MTSRTARCLRMSCCIKFNAGYFTFKIENLFSKVVAYQNTKAVNHIQNMFTLLPLSSCVCITHLLLCKPADPAIVSMTQTSCSDISPDTTGIITPCLANSVCYYCSTL